MLGGGKGGAHPTNVCAKYPRAQGVGRKDSRCGQACTRKPGGRGRREAKASARGCDETQRSRVASREQPGAAMRERAAQPGAWAPSPPCGRRWAGRPGAHGSGQWAGNTARALPPNTRCTDAGCGPTRTAAQQQPAATGALARGTASRPLPGCEAAEPQAGSSPSARRRTHKHRECGAEAPRTCFARREAAPDGGSALGGPPEFHPVQPGQIACAASRAFGASMSDSEEEEADTAGDDLAASDEQAACDVLAGAPASCQPRQAQL